MSADNNVPRRPHELDDDQIPDDLADMIGDDPKVEHELDWSGEIVYITARRTGPNARRRIFHTDPECRHTTDRTFPWPREGAEDWGFDICSTCDGSTTNDKCGNDHTKPLVQIGEMIDDPSDYTLEEMIDLYHERTGGSA